RGCRRSWRSRPRRGRRTAPAPRASVGRRNGSWLGSGMGPETPSRRKREPAVDRRGQRSGTAGERRGPRPVASPVRPFAGVGLAAGLLGKGVAQYLLQGVDARKVALLGQVDRLLREVVAQHVLRVGRVHRRLAL